MRTSPFSSTWMAFSSTGRLALQHDPPAAPLEPGKCDWAGVFELTSQIRASVRCTDSGLLVERSDRPAETYLRESGDVFFLPGRPRTRRIFQRGDDAVVTGFVDRREGLDVVWKKVE